MRRPLLIAVFSCIAVAGYAQSATPIQVPPKAIAQLEDLKELTKAEVVSGKVSKKAHAEVRPELNRYLVISADEFLRVATSTPTKEAYLKCIDAGLARVAPLTNGTEDRVEVAQYFQELMDIVGLDTSEGRLMAFVKEPNTQK